MNNIKEEINKIFGCSIAFNKDFDTYLEKIKEPMREDILKWCKECRDNIDKPNPAPNKKYKELLVFFKRIGSGTRITLIKKKNDDFIELHLTNHREYDKLREKLGFKKSSYYYT